MSKELYLPNLKQLRKILRKNVTNAEKYLWQFIRRKQLGYKFLRQVSIGYYVVDFYCKELAVAIEIDGQIHNQKQVKERDKFRQEIIESDGVLFLRFSNEEVFDNTEEVLLKITKVCQEIENNL